MNKEAKIYAFDGQAGVHAVATQLLLRGILPSFPTVDRGYDLILDNGLKIQVKIAHLSYPMSGGSYSKRPNFGSRGGTVASSYNYLGGAYGFNVRRGEWKGNRWDPHSKKGYADVADFFVLWGIEDNRFWVVPTSIKNRVIWFGRLDQPNSSNNASHTNSLKSRRNAAYENRWDLLDVNKTVETLIEGAPELAPKEN